MWANNVYATSTGMLLSLCVISASSTARAVTPQEVRDLIVDRVGSLDAMKVPANDDLMPQPTDSRFRITSAKKRLGKLLYFDPIRATDVRPEFGGLRSLAQTASCGSCHVAAAASKAASQIAIGMGGQGRGFIDATTGRFVSTRSVFPDLQDVLPTPFDMLDGVGNLWISGRFDAVDRPARTAPNMIGFATNQRLFWGGAGGEPYVGNDPSRINLNVNGLPTGENAVEVALGAHRMLGTQRFALQQNAVYMELFREAFPEEAAMMDRSRNKDDLINNETVERAIAAFLRSVITRNTPYDKFLAGDNSALTEQQLRGAWLFFSPPEAAGANCVACHSGPALNKALGDEAGQLVEENFHNIGFGDHPLFQMIRDMVGDQSLHDVGRQEATGSAADAFKFKAPTLRQARDGAPFTHSGGIKSVREMVEYINAGEPRSADAAAAGNVSELFTNPRGPGLTGLGLGLDDIAALVDFLENGLFDPAFVTYDPNSTTETFELNERDLSYSLPLVMLGAENGKLPSKLHPSQTDALSVQEMAAMQPPKQSLSLCGMYDILSLSLTLVPLMAASSRRRRRAA